jgi:hypothetical protein
MVHATGLDDAKALLRAGVDGFGHAFQEVDDELLSLIEARPKVFFLLALGGPRRLVTAPWLQPVHPLVQETVSPQQIARLRERLERQTAPERERAQAGSAPAPASGWVPTGAGSSAISSSAGRSTPRSRTWWPPA